MAANIMKKKVPNCLHSELSLHFVDLKRCNVTYEQNERDKKLNVRKSLFQLTRVYLALLLQT
uniref:Uncharacterized protein n=1 Tax=Octopus bimaculoides TaxID=37653 RepID=A0A0L8H9K6_OCTBM